MIVLLLIGGLAAAAAAAASFASSPPPMAPPSTGTPGQQPASTGTTSTPNTRTAREPQQPAPVPAPAADKGTDLGSLGSGGIFAAAGVAAGAIAGASAFTKDAKDIAAPVGLGVAAAAYLAVQVGGATVVGVSGAAVAGAAAGGYLIVPIILVTTAIITLIDGISRAIRAGEWKKLAIEVAKLRAAGKFREAMVLYFTKVGEIPEISRVWPQQGNPDDRDWYNPSDPLGRPYPGFPGPPAPATAAELAVHPEAVPYSVFTKGGHEIVIRPLFDALKKDVEEVRAWGLANGVPGKMVDAKGRVQVATEGDRDLHGWPPYMEALNNLSSWAEAVAIATPWIQRGALSGWSAPSIRSEVRTAELAAQKRTRQTNLITRVARTAGVSTAVAAAAVAEEQTTNTTRQDTASDRTERDTPERDYSDSRRTGGGTS